MKVLITGGTGQLGLGLVSELKKISWIELLVPARKALDISDEIQVNDYFEEYLPDVVINAAAFTAVDIAENMYSESFSVNHVGAANLAKASAKLNGIIIQISTDYVFDGSSERPYVENDFPNPLNVYGLSKLKGEQAVIQYNPQYIILRTSWLFSGEGKNFYSTILKLLDAKKPIAVVNDQIGAPTFILDLVNVIKKALEKLLYQKALDWGIYHYSGYPFISWFGFAEEIQKAIYPRGIECEIVGVSTAHYNSAAKRPLYSCLSSSKTCIYFGVDQSNWISRLKEIAIKTKSQ